MIYVLLLCTQVYIGSVCTTQEFNSFVMCNSVIINIHLEEKENGPTIRYAKCFEKGLPRT